MRQRLTSPVGYGYILLEGLEGLEELEELEDLELFKSL